MTKFFLSSLAFSLATALSPVLAAQSSPVGPMSAPAPDVVNIPTNPKPEPTSILPLEIIKRFAAKEDAFAQASRAFGYRKTIVVQEIGADGKPTGQVEVITAPFYTPDGKRYERVIGVPATPAPAASTMNPDQVAGPPPTTGDLHALHLEPEDVMALAMMPQFPFTTDQISKYNIMYQGKQRVDELNTYVFAIEPKQVDRQHAYFSGVIWVDDQEMAIVKSYGKWVTELGDVTSPKLPFTLFETYRQQVGDNWFPVYSRSDDRVTTKDDVIPVRLIIKWTDYASVPVPPSVAAGGSITSH